MSPLPRALFISYRRDDSPGEAGRLFDACATAFGRQNVFMDVTGIRFGIDFRDEIKANVNDCGVLLAIIGPQWAAITDPTGERRLDNPNDFVRVEIVEALERRIPVIPVLVHNARLPRASELPDELKPLVYRNCAELTHTRWDSDVAILLEALKGYVVPASNPTPSPIPAPAHAATSTLTSTSTPAPDQPSKPSKRYSTFAKTSCILGVVLCLGAVLGADASGVGWAVLFSLLVSAGSIALLRKPSMVKLRLYFGLLLVTMFVFFVAVPGVGLALLLYTVIWAILLRGQPIPATTSASDSSYDPAPKYNRQGRKKGNPTA
jgi:hypothetical protein